MHERNVTFPDLSDDLRELAALWEGMDAAGKTAVLTTARALASRKA